jgi:hypothetical protein
LVAALAGVVVATAAALAYDDAVPCTDTQPLFVCPQGTVEASYSIQFIGRGGCGPDPPNEGLPYQFRVVNGALPPGLSLAQGGQISGTPSQAGTYRFWAELSDQDPPSQSWCLPKKAEREFSITINPRVLVTTESTGPGTIGSPYALNLTAVMKSGATSTAAPSSPLTWTVVQGQLPAGLTLNSSTGVVSGTPTAEGASSFVVRAALVDGRADTKGLTITVRQALVVSPQKPFASTSVGAVTLWEVGVPFSSKFGATGGTGTYTWSLADGVLPAGMALAADGTVAGKPSAAGLSRATIRLTDSEGRIADYQAVIGVAAKLAISTTKLRPGKVGRAYRAKLSTTGGVLQKTWKITSGPLPRGIRFDRTLGVLSGTPTKPGRYKITFESTDALKVTAVKKLVIDVLV